jgi:hypothetical protein
MWTTSFHWASLGSVLPFSVSFSRSHLLFGFLELRVTAYINTHAFTHILTHTHAEGARQTGMNIVFARMCDMSKKITALICGAPSSGTST